MLAAFEAACWAAKGVPLRDPRKPSDPELFHDRTLPFMSEIVTIVLLKDACTNASPCGTCLRSFFLNVFFLPFFSGAAPVPPAAAGFAIKTCPWSFVVHHWSLTNHSRFWPTTSSQRPTTSLRLCRRLLLLRDCSFARTFSRTRTRVGTLSANRQV